MKLKGINASSKKTTDIIKKTLLELIEEKKEFEGITVTELVKKANITRGAFYSHYNNIYDVAREFEEEIIKKVFNDQKINNIEELNNYIDQVFQYLEDKKEIYSILLTTSESMLFLNRLSAKIYNSLSHDLNNKDLNILFFIAGTNNLIIKYFRKELKEDLNELCEYVKKVAEYFFF